MVGLKSNFARVENAFVLIQSIVSRIASEVGSDGREPHMLIFRQHKILNHDIRQVRIAITIAKEQSWPWLS